MFSPCSITSVSFVAVTEFDVVGSLHMVPHYALYVHIYPNTCACLFFADGVCICLGRDAGLNAEENNKDK